MNDISKHTNKRNELTHTFQFSLQHYAVPYTFEKAAGDEIVYKSNLLS